MSIFFVLSLIEKIRSHVRFHTEIAAKLHQGFPDLVLIKDDRM